MTAPGQPGPLARLLACYGPLLAGLAVLGLIVAGLSAYIYTGWRAHDLAAKSRDNPERGSVRFALLQAESARRLRGRSPAVVRAHAQALTAMQDPRAVDAWRTLASLTSLDAEDRRAMADAVIRSGTDAQFDGEQADLRAAGELAEASAWSGRRALHRGDHEAAAGLLREAAAADPSPGRQLELARVLGGLSDPASPVAAAAIVEELADSPEPWEALAFGLSSLPAAGQGTRSAWARRALDWMSPDNPALLPAASALIANRESDTPRMMERLDPVFAGADAARRVPYAQWLLAHGEPEAALGHTPAAEARTSQGVFLARAEALSALEDWTRLLDLVTGGGPVSEPVSLILRARADRGLGRPAAADASLRQALESSAFRGVLGEVLDEVDRDGRAELADEVVLGLCANHATAEYALRVAGRRFGERGEPRLREQALKHAREAFPDAPSVLDGLRRAALLDRQPVDTTATSAALEAEPGNTDFRLTHALALLRDGRSAEARRAVEPCLAVRHRLEPGQKAIVAAILTASGSPGEALELIRSTRSGQLSAGEYRLVYELSLAGSQLGE